MIIFYPPAEPFCIPVVVFDATDSSDQWSTGEIALAVYSNLPPKIFSVLPPVSYSCKYSYEVQHNGLPLGQALKMTLNTAIRMPPAELISQVSVGFVSNALDASALAAAAASIANPQVTIMYAVVAEKTGIVSNVSRSFIAYSSILQPDAYGVGATLYIQGASFSDSFIPAIPAFSINAIAPLGAQLAALILPTGYIIDYSAAPAALAPPRCAKLFQPTTITKILDEICLQNGLLYNINNQIVTLFSQTDQPLIGADIFLKTKFSFLGYAGAIMWAVGVENYANIKFKTPIFDAALFSKITLYNDSSAGLFSGLHRNYNLNLFAPASYDCIIIRYVIIRNDGELCCEVTASNDWVFSQTRLDGIFERKIYGGIAG